MDDLTALKNQVAMLMRAVSAIDKERQNEGKAPLLDSQVLMINRNVGDNLAKARVPQVKHPDFGKPGGGKAA